ncbi:MAG: hypothetical protein BJ554DRAFT_6442 [Olpidium bornovanus]|uniref:Uncharacterized protein n=1 Tax=Olpidium bornovanus TaxID=278681 RepID=A0A8H7ZXS7_9FUNG|nr:MAG: hypothetical protein BJ554DRAFT_6442 [Olpidium bornovanus]
MSAVKALSKVREGDSDKFHRCTERVHRAQKLLLDTIYLVYSGLDNDLKCPRDYRRHLPSEDQEELDDGFSENILFAAEALSRGFRIRGIERFTEQLLDPAKQLCAGFEALRFVFRSRALDLHRAGPAAAPAATQPPSQTSPPSRGPRFARRSATVPAAAHGALHPRHVPGGAAARRWHGPFASLYPVLIDFDKAWVVFEQKICFAYFAVTYSRHSDAAVPDTIPDTFPAVFPTPDDGTETFAALISEALGRAVKGNLIPQSRVQELHPSVMFAVPRLAVVAGLVHMPDRVDLTDNDCALWWLRDKAAALRELQRDLRSLSRGDLEALEMALAGRGSGEEDPEDAGPEQRAASAAAARADPGPDPDPDPAAAPPRTPSRPRQRQRPSAPAAGAAAAGTGGGDGGGEAAGAGRPGPGPRAAGEAEVPAAQRDGGPGPDRRRSRPVPSGPAEPAGAASPPAPDLRRLFTAVCNIADRLQSGPCAHEFSGVLEKAFRFHSS